MNGFEVPFPDSELERQIMVEANTWGYDWHDSDGPQVKLLCNKTSR